MRAQYDRAALFAAIRDGDQAAFEVYYNEKILYLVSIIGKMTGDRDEAWDIAQNTFVKLWTMRQQLDPIRSLDSLLDQMGINAAHNAWKKRQVVERYRDEQKKTLNGEERPADTDLITREVQRKIDAIIDNMPTQRRRVYLLSREEGLTYKEIAQRMGISPGTVHRHMSIALEELRDIMSVLVSLATFPFV